MAEDLLNEIRERLVRIETKLDRYDTVESKAFEAFNMAQNLCATVCEMKEGQRWLVRTTVVSVLSAVIAVLGAIMTMVFSK